MTNKLTQNQIEKWHDTCPIHVYNIVNESKKFINRNVPLRLIDIGSNVGVFGELIREYTRIENAILFEPVEELYDYCRYNHPEWNHHNLVASDVDGIVKFNVEFGDNLGLGRIVSHDLSSVREYQSVHIGNFLLNHYSNFDPHLIKIDAEGHDIIIMLALLDYVKTLNDVVLVFEVSGLDDYTVIEESYKKLGFTTWRSSPKDRSGDIWVYKE